MTNSIPRKRGLHRHTVIPVLQSPEHRGYNLSKKDGDATEKHPRQYGWQYLASWLRPPMISIYCISMYPRTRSDVLLARTQTWQLKFVRL
jgi:hypothetical protein